MPLSLWYRRLDADVSGSIPDALPDYVGSSPTMWRNGKRALLEAVGLSRANGDQWSNDQAPKNGLH